MSVVFAIHGVEKLTANLEKLRREKAKRLKEAVHKAAYLVLGDAQKRILRGDKTGRVYGDHRASAPDESPASDTGNLVRSGRVDLHEDFARVVFTAAYALALEYGTNDGKIAERPFLRPALEENREAIRALLSEALYGN